MSSGRKNSDNLTLTNEHLVELRQNLLESSPNLSRESINEIVRLKNFQVMIYLVESKLWRTKFQNKALLALSIKTLVDNHKNDTHENIENQFSIIEFLLTQGANSVLINRLLDQKLLECYSINITTTSEISYPDIHADQETPLTEDSFFLTKFFNSFKNNFYSVVYPETAVNSSSDKKTDAIQPLPAETKTMVTEVKSENDPETIKLIARIKEAFQTSKKQGSKAQRNQSIKEIFDPLIHEKKLIDLVTQYDNSSYKPTPPSSKGLFSKIGDTDTKRIFSFLNSKNLAKVIELSSVLHDGIIKDAPLKNQLINGILEQKTKYDISYVKEQNFQDLLSWIERIKNKANTADDLNSSVVIKMCEQIGLLRFITQKSGALGEAASGLAFLYYGCNNEYKKAGSITNFWRSCSNDTIFEETRRCSTYMKQSMHTIQTITNFLPAEEEMATWKELWEKEWKPYSEKLKQVEDYRLRTLRH